MNNVKRVISSHNKRLLKETKSAQESTKDSSKQLCNCRNANECPLNNMCLTKDLVYQAEVITKEDNDIKTYIGMTATKFKDRYRNHKKSFEDIKHENDTELSKHVWKLKTRNNLVYTGQFYPEQVQSKLEEIVAIYV